MPAICETCGLSHHTWPPDIAFQRPDAVWNMPGKERAVRVKENDDLCVVDGERHFIRAVLFIPLPERDEQWGIGLWVEIAHQDFARYLGIYDSDPIPDGRRCQR